jgi:ferredoxin-NADP reductase
MPDRSLLVRAMTWDADGVMALDLVAPDGGDLGGFEPGAHIDLYVAPGVERQYSLCGDPADRRTWRIAVRLVAGGAGSGAVHRTLRPGNLVRAAGPRNNFPFVPAPGYLFVAGGIGITPLLPMIRAAGPNWRLLYCFRDLGSAAFLPLLGQLAAATGGILELFVSSAGRRLDVAAELAAPRAGEQLYCCGPDSLMTAVEAATGAWPEGSVHFEWFTPRAQAGAAETGGFELSCARSGITLAVPAGRRVLDILTENGIAVPTSCEQGICGTCECAVLEGEVDHRDSILSASERAAHATMMVCVSRARSPRLVLDL